MAWSVPVAVVVFCTAHDGRDGRSVVLRTTSTSTVWDSPSEQLRMYGVAIRAIRRSWPGLNWLAPDPPGACPRHLDAAEDVVTWLPGGRLADGSFGFQWTPTGQADGSPLRSTCLPTYRPSERWPLRTRLGYGDQVEDRTARVDVAAVYKDLDIVELPNDRGWLALAVRLRVLEETVDEGRSPPKGPGRGSGPTPWSLLLPGTSVADIVAFWSPTLDFDGQDTEGPFLLVDSLSSQPDVDVRAWLGVPSATFGGGPDDRELLVYYVTEAPPAPYVDRDEGYRSQSLERGIAVRRIALADLLSRVDDERRRKRPGRWTNERRWHEDAVVDGELLGPARTWVAVPGDGEREYRVRPLADVYGGLVHTVDPEAVACPGGTDLLFSAQSGKEGVLSSGETPYTVWHAAGLPQGLPLTNAGTGESWTATEGVDFVVRPPGGRFSVDQLPLVRSGEGGAATGLDPDAVELPGGRWQVYVGSRSGAGLRRFDGNADDMCPGWQAAWASAP